MKLETIKVFHPEKGNGFMIINKNDFNEDIHEAADPQNPIQTHPVLNGKWIDDEPDEQTIVLNESVKESEQPMSQNTPIVKRGRPFKR